MRNAHVARLVRSAAAVIAVAGALSGLCNASEFSAERVIKSGRKAVTSVCYVRGDSSRSETTMGSERRIVINRPDKGVLWMLNPAKKEYVERKCQPAYSGYVERLVRQGARKQLVRTERVSGQNCDKYLITPSDRKEGATIVWVSRKLGHPIKIRTKSVSVIYERIRERKLPDTLFEVPKGYRKR